MLVYKVVNKWGGAYRSSSAWFLAPTVWVMYVLGEVTRPILPGSKLFAFDSLENARNYTGNSISRRILVCECESMESITGMIPPPERARSSWTDGKLVNPDGEAGRFVPRGSNGVLVKPGTVLADWLKPVEVVQDVGI